LLILVTDTDNVLLRGEGKKLSDYRLTHGSNVVVCMRLPGGSDHLAPLPGLIRVTRDQPDMISLDESPSVPKAVMPCGHVIS